MESYRIQPPETGYFHSALSEMEWFYKDQSSVSINTSTTLQVLQFGCLISSKPLIGKRQSAYKPTHRWLGEMIVNKEERGR